MSKMVRAMNRVLPYRSESMVRIVSIPEPSCSLKSSPLGVAQEGKMYAEPHGYVGGRGD